MKDCKPEIIISKEINDKYFKNMSNAEIFQNPKVVLRIDNKGNISGEKANIYTSNDNIGIGYKSLKKNTTGKQQAKHKAKYKKRHKSKLLV